MKWTAEMVESVIKAYFGKEPWGCSENYIRDIVNKLNAPKQNEAQRLWLQRLKDKGLDADASHRGKTLVMDFLSTLHVVPEKATEEMGRVLAYSAGMENHLTGADLRMFTARAQALLDYLRDQS